MLPRRYLSSIAALLDVCGRVHTGALFVAGLLNDAGEKAREMNSNYFNNGALS